MSRRAAIYCRVSSTGQAERGTIESQRRVLHNFVTKQGWELVGVFEDDGRSAAAGKLEARDGFARLAAAAARREFDVLVIVDVDRLSRTDDLLERAVILSPFQRAGITIVSPAGGEIDLRSQLGEMQVTLQALGAAAWLEKHRERVRQGRITAIARGRLPAGPPPFGLLYDSATKTLLVHPERGPVVAEIFQRVAGGESCAAVALDLEARGVSRPRGSWCRAMVARIIRSRHARGEWLADKTRGVTISVPELVDEELWQRAQIAVARSGRRGLHRERHPYLLLRLAVCGLCGASVHVRTGDTGSSAVYLCSARLRQRSGFERCASPTVRVDAADARAWAAVRRELEDPELDRAVAGEVAARNAGARTWVSDAATWGRKLDRLQTAEQALLSRFTRGAVSETALDAELARISRERTALQAQLETAGRAATSAADSGRRLRDAGAILAQLRDRLADAPFAVRRALVERLVQPGGIVVDGGDIRITLLVPRPEVAGDAACLVERTASSLPHETHLRIRTVA